MNNEHYKIKTRAEETECEVCGYPLYVGDQVTMDLDTSLAYCSVVCAKQDQPVLVIMTTWTDDKEQELFEAQETIAELETKMTEWTDKQVRSHFLGVVDENLTQKELAKTIGISEASISRFINGEIGPGEKMLDYLGLERVFRYRPTQSPLPHDSINVIPQSELGKGGVKPLIDKPDNFY